MITKNKKDQQIFGFGCHSDPKYASRKAFFEAIQNLPALTSSTGTHRTTLDSFQNNIIVTPKDHGFLGLDQEYSAQLNSMFSSEFVPSETRRLVPSFTFTTYDTSSFTPNLDLKLVQASTSELQKYFLGKPSRETLNWKRLSFIDPSVTWETINTLPHFIG